MPDQSSTQQLPELDRNTAMYLEEMLRIAESFRGQVRLQADTRIKQAELLLKDYGQYSLATLGGAITIETVGAHLIKSKPLFFISAALLIVSVVVSFVARTQLNDRMNDFREQVENHVSNVTAKVGIIRIDSSPQNIGALQEASVFRGGFKNSWLTDHGRNATAVLFLIGFLGLAASLIFYVTA